MDADQLEQQKVHPLPIDAKSLRLHLAAVQFTDKDQLQSLVGTVDHAQAIATKKDKQGLDGLLDVAASHEEVGTAYVYSHMRMFLGMFYLKYRWQEDNMASWTQHSSWEHYTRCAYLPHWREQRLKQRKHGECNLQVQMHTVVHQQRVCAQLCVTCYLASQ
jgi:hypothetical protein